MSAWLKSAVAWCRFEVPHRKPALNILQCDATTLHAFPAAFHIVREFFCGHPACQVKQRRICQPPTLLSPLHQPEEFPIIVWLHNVGTNVDTLVADERGRPSNELAHLVLALPAE